MHPTRTFWIEARKRELLRCLSPVDWPVYPRVGRIVRAE
jgi:hypothetical protein